MNNADLDIRTLNCTKKAIADLEETEEKCSESGKLFNVGFKLDDSFFKVFEICYDNEKSTVLYTKHIINGKGIRCELKALENDKNTPF